MSNTPSNLTELFLNFGTSSIQVPVDIGYFEHALESYALGDDFCRLSTANNQILVINMKKVVSMGRGGGHLMDHTNWSPLNNDLRIHDSPFELFHWFCEIQACCNGGAMDRWNREYKSKVMEVLVNRYGGDSEDLCLKFIRAGDFIDSLGDIWLSSFPRLTLEEELIYLSDYIKVMYGNGSFYTYAMWAGSDYKYLRNIVDDDLTDDTIVKIRDEGEVISYAKLSGIDFIAIPKYRYQRCKEYNFIDEIVWN